jgi:hypothetical protein
VVDPKPDMHGEEPGHEDISSAQLDREMAAAGFARLSLDERTLPQQYVAIYRPRGRPSESR